MCSAAAAAAAAAATATATASTATAASSHQIEQLRNTALGFCALCLEVHG